jgi:hypothetical protein
MEAQVGGPDRRELGALRFHPWGRQHAKKGARYLWDETSERSSASEQRSGWGHTKCGSKRSDVYQRAKQLETGRAYVCRCAPIHVCEALSQAAT